LERKEKRVVYESISKGKIQRGNVPWGKLQCGNSQGEIPNTEGEIDN